MKASQCSFNYMLKLGHEKPDSGEILSFVQVEYGLKELEGMWDAFCDANEELFDNYFKSKREIVQSFVFELEELIHDTYFINESSSKSLG